MDIEDEPRLKDDLSEAEAAFAPIADAYREAEDKVEQARAKLDEWYALFG